MTGHADPFHPPPAFGEARRPEPPISPPDRYTYAAHVADDDDYEYFWSLLGYDVPIPRWLAEIVDVPLVVRLEIFMVGVCTGLIVGALALLIAMYSAM